MDISVMLMLLYFLITKLYCALIALWKPRRISSQMKQYNADMSHCQYMFSKRKQQWSHIKILLSSTNTSYNFNIMKVCIPFYAFLNPGEKKSDFWFSLWNSIFFISHFQTNIVWSFCRHVKGTVAPADWCVLRALKWLFGKPNFDLHEH
jgi:hypothetical protein